MASTYILKKITVNIRARYIINCTFFFFTSFLFAQIINSATIDIVNTISGMLIISLSIFTPTFVNLPKVNNSV